jgi:hypothetical protein
VNAPNHGWNPKLTAGPGLQSTTVHDGRVHQCSRRPGILRAQCISSSIRMTNGTQTPVGLTFLLLIVKQKLCPAPPAILEQLPEFTRAKHQCSLIVSIPLCLPTKAPGWTAQWQIAKKAPGQPDAWICPQGLHLQEGSCYVGCHSTTWFCTFAGLPPELQVGKK